MNNKRTPARLEYEAALENLRELCESVGLMPVIIDSEYPIRVQLVPDMQVSMFGNENVDENGEVNDLTVTCGLTATVKSTLKFKMDSKLLKKLIKLAEKVGFYYYHAFREEQGERITRRRPEYEADGYDPDGNLAYDTAYCPECRHSFEYNVNDWGSAFCPDCGQALDWTPEPEPDEYEAGLEKLRELCEDEEAKK